MSVVALRHFHVLLTSASCFLKLSNTGVKPFVSSDRHLFPFLVRIICFVVANVKDILL